LGIVENYSYLECPDCGKKIELFGKSNIDEVANGLGLKVLGKVPLMPAIAELADGGIFHKMESEHIGQILDNMGA